MIPADDKFEIDIVEAHFPNGTHLAVHSWDTSKGTAIGFDAKFVDNFSQEYHPFGVLWTPTGIVYEIDGEPIAAVVTNGAIAGSADIRFSSALADWAGKVADNPVGHNMYVRQLRVVPVEP